MEEMGEVGGGRGGGRGGWSACTSRNFPSSSMCETPP